MIIKKKGQNLDSSRINNLIIASRPGTGKTSSLLQLPNCIFFDLENSSHYFNNEADVVDIISMMKEEKIGMYSAIRKAIKYIKDNNLKYQFCIIDTLTKLDDLADTIATKKYKETPQGKSFTGASVKELAFGAGYGLCRAEFSTLVEMFSEIADTIIYSSHVKDSSIPKDGDQYAVTDLNLTGSLKEIFSAKQDAACLLEIDPTDKNKRILNFEKSEQNGFIKSRASHLHNQKIVISEYDPQTKTLKTNWNQIFLNIK